MNIVNPNMLALCLFLALVNNRVIEYFVTPLFDRYAVQYKHLILYVSLLTAALIVWPVDVTLFAEVIPNPIGRVLTVILVAGGANLIHDLTDTGVKLPNIFQKRL